MPDGNAVATEYDSAIESTPIRCSDINTCDECMQFKQRRGTHSFWRKERKKQLVLGASSDNAFGKSAGGVLPRLVGKVLVKVVYPRKKQQLRAEIQHLLV